MRVMEKIFGSDKVHVWEELSRHIGGKFIRGHVWDVDRVEAKIDGWNIIMDSCALLNGQLNLVFTRIRAPFINNNGIRFEIYNRGIINRLAACLRMHSLEIHESEFDIKYVVKGNDTEMIRRLFSDTDIQGLIEFQPSIHLKILDGRDCGYSNAQEKTGVLSFVEIDIINSLERLKKLFELFVSILNKLEESGKASKLNVV